jgi:hypothetical protein
MLHNVSCNFAILLIMYVSSSWETCEKKYITYHWSSMCHYVLANFFISNSLREKEEEANKFVKMYGLIFLNISLQMAHLFI